MSTDLRGHEQMLGERVERKTAWYAGQIAEACCRQPRRDVFDGPSFDRRLGNLGHSASGSGRGRRGTGEEFTIEVVVSPYIRKRSSSPDNSSMERRCRVR